MLTRPVWKLFDRLRQWHDRRTLDPAHATGRKGEDVAHRHLQAKGLIVINRNWRSRSGLCEIDIIAWQRAQPDRLIIVEVKSRQNSAYASPDRNIDQGKLQSLRRAAREYCRQNHIAEELVRFDTVSVVFHPMLQIEHNSDAFAL